MKVVNVSELKAHLSKYLRIASRGEPVLVKDRNEHIAEIVAARRQASSWRERAEREGRLRRGTQDWARLRIQPLTKGVDIQSSLRAVREDPSEVRRR
jgi:prevent-host-death family protein